jgi:hypothetical protein
MVRTVLPRLRRLELSLVQNPVPAGAMVRMGRRGNGEAHTTGDGRTAIHWPVRISDLADSLVLLLLLLSEVHLLAQVGSPDFR